MVKKGLSLPKALLFSAGLDAIKLELYFNIAASGIDKSRQKEAILTAF